MKMFLFRGFVSRIKKTISLAEKKFEEFFQISKEERNGLLLTFEDSGEEQ